MDDATEGELLSKGVASLLVLLPLVGGALLFLLFERGPIHRLGFYLLGAGALVGVVLLLMRLE